MSGAVADTSIWIDFLAGRPATALEEALAQGTVVLPPLVVAELISGAGKRADRLAIGELLQELAVHDTPLEHWIGVGDLRRTLKEKGLNVSTPDAHIAQCALDRDAVLLTRDAVFRRIARVTKLRVAM